MLFLILTTLGLLAPAEVLHVTSGPKPHAGRRVIRFEREGRSFELTFQKRIVSLGPFYERDPIWEVHSMLNVKTKTTNEQVTSINVQPDRQGTAAVTLHLSEFEFWPDRYGEARVRLRKDVSRVARAVLAQAAESSPNVALTFNGMHGAKLGSFFISAEEAKMVMDQLTPSLGEQVCRLALALKPAIRLSRRSSASY